MGTASGCDSVYSAIAGAAGSRFKHTGLGYETAACEYTLLSHCTTPQHTQYKHNTALVHRISTPLHGYPTTSGHCCLSTLLPQCTAASLHCCLSTLTKICFALSLTKICLTHNVAINPFTHWWCATFLHTFGLIHGARVLVL